MAQLPDSAGQFVQFQTGMTSSPKIYTQGFAGHRAPAVREAAHILRSGRGVLPGPRSVLPLPDGVRSRRSQRYGVEIRFVRPCV